MDWDAVFEEIAAENRKASDNVDPVKMKKKADEEFAKGVRLGWWDANGDPINSDDDDDDDEENSDD